jgi:hypothetical protein
MHAVVVNTRVTEEVDPEGTIVRDQIIPAIKNSPGFVRATFLEAVNGVGLSVVVFDSEEAARGAAAAMGVGPGASLVPGTSMESVDYIAVLEIS